MTTLRLPRNGSIVAFAHSRLWPFHHHHASFMTPFLRRRVRIESVVEVGPSFRYLVQLCTLMGVEIGPVVSGAVSDRFSATDIETTKQVCHAA